WVFMLAAVALTIISMLDYIAKSKDVLGFGKSDDKEKDDDNTVEFSVDEKCAALASNVVEAAIEKQITLACAESLTGGMICAALTSVPGSSAVIKGGINSYATSVKQEILGVEGAVIEKDGAVSASCASAMAKGVSERLGAHLSVAVTGVAGPDKDERRNEVGLVYIAVLFDGNVNVEEHKFKGNRNEIRNQTCICALEALARALS
ncbi:MAG: CinA family protein, partial [Eggerthellaceae bacterium]|nr:CinA family protein [Eggerthellaceae bacterium]